MRSDAGALLGEDGSLVFPDVLSDLVLVLGEGGSDRSQLGSSFVNLDLLNIFLIQDLWQRSRTETGRNEILLILNGVRDRAASVSTGPQAE